MNFPKPGDLYLRDGKIWKVMAVAEAPTMTLECIDPNGPLGERESGVIGCLNFRDFIKLVPEINASSCAVPSTTGKAVGSEPA